MTTHEAVLGGARWRLTLHPDGTWTVWRLGRRDLVWDDMASGDQGISGLRYSAEDLRKFGEWFAEAGSDVLEALADVAERSTT